MIYHKLYITTFDAQMNSKQCYRDYYLIKESLDITLNIINAYNKFEIL